MGTRLIYGVYNKQRLAICRGKVKRKIDIGTHDAILFAFGCIIAKLAI
jgi:hypothetical protein